MSKSERKTDEHYVDKSRGKEPSMGEYNYTKPFASGMNNITFGRKIKNKY